MKEARNKKKKKVSKKGEKIEKTSKHVKGNKAHATEGPPKKTFEKGKLPRLLKRGSL